MKRIRRVQRLLDRHILKNVAVLMGGSAVAQAVTVFSAPLITRLFDPDAFGQYGLVLALSAPIATIACLRYELAIVLPRRDEEGANLLTLSMTLAVVIPLLITLSVALFGAAIARALGDEAIRPLLWWVPVIVALTGAFQSASYWSTRRQRFGDLAMTTTGKSVATVGVQGVAGYSGAAVLGLILGHVVGLAFGVATLWSRILLRDISSVRAGLRLDSIVAAARAHARFPAFSAPQALVNALSRNAPLLVLGAFFGPGLVGYYLLAHRVLKMPLTLLGNAFRQALYPRAAEVARSHGLRRLVVRSTLGLCLAALPPCLVLLLTGPQLFAFVFGADWAPAGVYAQALSVWLMTGLVAAPSLVAVNVLGLQRMHALLETGSLVIRISALAIGGVLGDDVLAVRMFAIVGLVSNAAIVGIVMNHCHRSGTAGGSA